MVTDEKRECYYCNKIVVYEKEYPLRRGRFSAENEIFRCSWHSQFQCSHCNKFYHFSWLYWCPTTKSLICGNCNNPTLNPLTFWNLKYAYEFYCDQCNENHFDLYYSEFQGNHPWQNGEKTEINCVLRENTAEQMWKPKNIQSGKEIPLEIALVQENKGLLIRKQVAEKVGTLKFHSDLISESEITRSYVYKQWEETSNDWLDIHKDKLSSEEGDFNRRHIIDPALWSLIGEVKGLSVLDAGCGNGYLSRKLAQKGANVIGVDHSKTFIDYCIKREKGNNLNCQFLVASLDDLFMIRSNSIDLIISNIVFVDVLPYKQAFKELSRVLKLNGRLIWSNLHPVFGKVPNIFYRLPYDTRRNEERLYVLIDRYFDSGGTLLSWGKLKPIWQFDRTLSEYSRALKNTGFVIREIIEPRPDNETIRKYPELAYDVDRIPFFIIYECLKIE